MKKVLFGLIATVLFSGMSFGQTNDPSNSKNEYDYVGKLHNEGLNKMLGNSEQVGLVKKDYLNTTISFLNENKINSDGIVKILKDEKTNNTLGIFDATKVSISKELLDSYLAKGYISKDSNILLNEVLIQVQFVDNGGDFTKFKNEMLLIESRANNLNTKDREFVLSVSSIARYSSYFWSNYTPTSRVLSKGGSIKGAAIADLAGAVGGGVRFGVVALFGGPAGWGACGIACLSTGLGASAVYGVAHLF